MLSQILFELVGSKWPLIMHLPIVNPSGHTCEEFYSSCVHFTQVKDGVIITAFIVEKESVWCSEHVVLLNTSLVLLNTTVVDLEVVVF